MDINKKKYQNAMEILNYIKNMKMPSIINKSRITLIALLDFFQKRFVLRTFTVDLTNFRINPKKLDLDIININSKINNFPHLIGIRAKRDDFGNIISRVKPKEFLDGVLYQWILLSSHEDFSLDYEKLEVFSWITQTLSNPTYILLGSSINKNHTKIIADLIFIRKVFNSSKYSFHIVGLKKENNGSYAFVSQFAIKTIQYNRIKKMFNIDEAIYDFYK